MSWRSLLITKPARLRIDRASLAISQELEVRVPLEDIAVIVLDHVEITLTHPVLSACAEYGIVLYSLGPNHHPNGLHLPFLQHSRTTRRLRQQQSLSRPALKRLWARIIRRKIENQAACLRLSECESSEYLESLSRRIRSGDPQNLESYAALTYFNSLFGRKFSRKMTDWNNGALNYGYAILRGAIARYLVAYGFHPSIGIFHDSERNAFNLADDVIEPFRPLVDLHVFLNSPSGPVQGLLTDDKAKLVSLLNVDMQMPQGRMSALSSIEWTIQSLTRVYEKSVDPNSLELPALIGLDAHETEI
ncbi:MAG: type II CRISPR-associated endonuclease Cas1 [Gammaproteobacteria bacterium]|nr:type II CRISPR-associated endonuclease Cas1 [Gammaproteobacteria bacterium]